MSDDVNPQTTCRKCGLEITRRSDGTWRDDTNDPVTCFRAADFKHTPREAADV